MTTIAVPFPLPTEADLDTMSERKARDWADRLYEVSPEVVEAIEQVTRIASPTAGRVRILRELLAHFGGTES